MQHFFTDFEALDRFTLSLDSHPASSPCPHCSKSDPLISHGVIYKQRSRHEREAVGKRVLCSNRYQKGGCGRTFPLYVADALPGRHYGAAHLFAFLSALFLGMAVESAYRRVTGRNDARHGWRWLHRLAGKLIEFRFVQHSGFPAARTDPILTPVRTQTRRLRLLLPTLRSVLARYPTDPCAGYQLDHQTAFL